MRHALHTCYILHIADYQLYFYFYLILLKVNEACIIKVKMFDYYCKVNGIN